MITDQLKVTLANHIDAAFAVQGYHWNIEGEDFNQYHDFFGDIYDDYFAQVDRLAEYVRIMSQSTEYVNATSDVTKANRTVKTQVIVGAKPIEMTNAIIVLNDTLIDDLNKLFKSASDENEQGLADYCASRLDAMKKLNWKMRAITK